VVRWVDRLGRNYEDVCDTIRHFMRRGVVIRTVINNFTFDGSTKDAMQQAVRDALIAFMAATAQAQAEASKAAQRAGIEHAKQHGKGAYLGRKPSYTRQQYERARTMLAQGAVGIARVAKETGLTRQTIYRIQDDPAAAEASLAAWGAVTPLRIMGRRCVPSRTVLLATALSLSRYHRPPVTATINPSSRLRSPRGQQRLGTARGGATFSRALWKRAPSKFLQFLG
jgi:putative DNA-invertase from lambdoid prophage Rac